MAVRSEIARFGLFEVDLAQGVLMKQGRTIKLQEQPLRILAILLENPGQTVTREQLRNALWTADTFVDFDRSLNAAVAKLRQALGDSADNPRFIETQARRGYRFIAPVNVAAEPVPVLTTSEPPESRFRIRSLVWVAAAALCVLLIGSGILYYRTHGEQRKSFVGALPPPVPLTTYTGFQSEPTFSPEGSRVAFAWQESGKTPSKIFVKLIGSSQPMRLTTSEGNDFAPAWSPDGRYIAFLRSRESLNTIVMLIPSLGGPERELTRLHLDPTRFLDKTLWTVPSPLLAWSPDNKWLLTLEQGPPEAVRIIRISVESGERTPFNLFTDSSTASAQGNLPGTSADGGLVLSSDGRSLAFARSGADPNSNLFVVSLSAEMLPAGPLRSVHFDRSYIRGIAWAPDGHDLVVSSDRRGSPELWRVPVDSQREPVNLNVNDGHPGQLAVLKTAQRLVFTHDSKNNVDIWRADLRSSRDTASAPFITSTRYEARPAYSADGKRIAFESDRTGNEEVWTANADGSQPTQLTAFGKLWSGSPVWSPDDRQIAFDSNAAGKWEVYVMPSQGGKPVRFAGSAASSVRPSWSHDGRWIYYCASQNSGPQIWKKPAAGGPEIQVTKNGGCDPLESADGAYVYYLKSDDRSLWRVPTSGGQETSVLAVQGEMQFRLGMHGAYFVDLSAPTTVKYFNFSSGASNVIGVLREPVSSQTGLAISPDERWLLYGKDQLPGSQLMLVEGFR
jgi:Tol biopolymer transport system component/DNA-binding winged helix-turn-helix (wHTH) protein